MSLGRPAAVYDTLVAVAGLFAPPGKTRRRLARRFHCEAAMVPHALLCHAAIRVLTGLIVLLCLRGLVLICAD